MARILFTLLPLTGHLNPALPVAAELARRGHEVAWALHARTVGAQLPPGARVYALDENDDSAAVQSPPVRGLESVRLFFEDYAFPLAERALPAMEAAVRDFRPQVIAADCQMAAGAWAARMHDLPWVSLVTTSASLLKMSPPVQAWVEDRYRALQQRCLPAPLVRVWPDFSPQRVVVFSIEALAGGPSTSLAQAEPARYEADYAFVGIPHADARKAVEFPWDWLRDDRRKLLVTLGTVSRDLEPRFFETVIDAMRQLPQVQAVIVAPDALISKRSTLQPPDNVLLRRYVPQPQLLQRVDGVICHAGHNTVCETLLNGLPLIVSPIRDDQPVVAQQVVAAGAALFLRHGKATPAAVRDAAQRLLTDAQLVDSARRLAQQLRSAPGSAGAADVIEALTAAPVAVRS